MAPPVAIVTGAGSGIGLALTKHLLSLGWAVGMLDLNPPPEDLGSETLFVKTDVSSWDQQAAAFAQVFAWRPRLDFAALNAGIDDRDDIFHSIDPTAEHGPRRPNLKTFEVNLNGTYYGLKLAAHYMSRPATDAGKPLPGGKIVVTASAAGINPMPVAPQYGASKHALVGLVRSAAPNARAAADITVNALCPALVATNLAPPGLLDAFKEEQFTPMATMLRGFEALAGFAGVGEEGWVKGGVNGETVEGNLGELVWHRPPQRREESSVVDEEGVKAWEGAYRERNVRFAREEWMAKGR